MKRPPFLEVLVRSEPFRVFQIGLGALLMLVAPIIGIPTPGPLGIFIFAFGLALVLRNSSWARRRYVRYTRRYPRVQRAVNFGLRRKSKRRVPVPKGPIDPVPTMMRPQPAQDDPDQPAPCESQASNA